MALNKKYLEMAINACVEGANQWKKGKVRIKISFEFCPDEPEISEYESPLDEIRREMNQGL